MKPDADTGQPNTLFPFVLAVVSGVATGVLWAYANPIQLVPGVIQWRIFAFLPPLIGLLFGPRTGFVCGYLGTVVWSLLAGTFIPLHTLVVDGLTVGLTGAVPPLAVKLRSGQPEPRHLLIRIAGVCALTGIFMVIAVSASLAYLRVFPFWFALLNLGLSDIVPMVVGTPLLIRPALRVVAGVGRGKAHRF
jgi:energy-coupling factor transport system substrate-specific component